MTPTEMDMMPEQRSPGTYRDLAAQCDRLAAFLIGIVWPVFLVPSPLSAHFFISLAVAMLSAAVLIENRQSPPLRLLAGQVFSPFRAAPAFAIALLTLVVVSLLSVFWSIAPELTLNRAAQFAAITVVGIMFTGLAGRLAHTPLLEWLAIGIILGCIVAGLDRVLGSPLLEAVGENPDAASYNRPIWHYSVLLCPVLWLWPKNRLLVTAAAAVVAASVATSEMEAAKLGLLAGAFTLVFALVSVRAAKAALAIAFVAAMVFLPFFIGTLAKALPQELVLAIGYKSALVRVEIWSHIQAQLIDVLPFGIGFNATRFSPPMDPVMFNGEVADPGGPPFHPHNTPLQVMYEVGLLATAAVVVIGLSALAWIGRQNRRVAIPALVAFASVLAAIQVSAGAWPTWRIALYALVAGIFVVVAERARTQKGSAHSSARWVDGGPPREDRNHSGKDQQARYQCHDLDVKAGERR